MLKAQAFSEYRQICFQEFSLLLELVHEKRNSARVSFAKDKAILRIPILSSNLQKEQFIRWAHDWIYKKLAEDPKLRSKYIPKNYSSGQLIQIRGKEFKLEVKEELSRKTAVGELKVNVIFIQLPSGINGFQKQKLCSTIISRIMANVFHKEISDRVMEINKQFFNKTIKSVRLKHNSSNWGSCSSKNNINLSTRLLLTPQFITDYIIVHELAHLVYMDHSDKYWKLVGKIMPEYEKAELWLKKNGEQCSY